MVSPKLADPLYIAGKAALAALLSVLVVDLFGVTDRLSAPFVAVVCTAPSVYGGVRRGFDQLAASLLGGTIAVLVGMVLPVMYTLIIATFATVWLAFRTGLGGAYIVGAFTVFYVLLIPSQSFGVTLEHRLASVLTGASSALAMNLLVSLFRLRAVLRRRLEIARTALAHDWALAADRLAWGEAARAVVAPEPFDDVFPLLRALQAELLDARAEGRFRSRGFRAEVEAALHDTKRMVAVAHHGKDLVIAADEAPGPRPALSAAARALSEAVKKNEAASPALINASVKGTSDPELDRPFEKALRQWNDGRA